MSILRYNRQPVKAKATRKTARPDRPFASGLLGHSESDEKWYYARLREQAEPTDEEYDAMAAESEWYLRYERGLTGPERCYLCQAPSDSLIAGLCPTCVDTLDRDGEIHGDGGLCNICGRPCDYLEESGACLPCDLSLHEKHSFSGPRGY